MAAGGAVRYSWSHPPSPMRPPSGRRRQAGPVRTVLDGVFTTAQAERGAGLYVTQCAACHEGADVDGPPLTGAPFVDRWREDTLASLFDFIKTEMPQQAPGSLSERQYLDIIAHLLHENDYPPGQRSSRSMS